MDTVSIWEIQYAEPDFAETHDKLVGSCTKDGVCWSSSIAFPKGSRSPAVLENIRKGLEDGSVTPAYVREHLAK